MPNGPDDPFKPPNATVLRPRPGAGKRTPVDPAPARPAPGGMTRTAGPAPDDLPAVPVRALQGSGLSPLVAAATPLLLLAGGLRGSTTPGDVPGLRRQALDEIRRFEERARAAGVANEVVVAGRYALCAAIDEAVLATPWGAHSDWAQQTLLIALHREAYGGEKFFEMLERIGQDPQRHIELMELQYLCIALGFAGKFQVADRGHLRLAEVQHDVFRRIRTVRNPPEPELSLRWRGVEDRRNRLIRYVPWWVVGAAALAVMTIAFVYFKHALDERADPVYAALNRIGTEGFATAAPAPAAVAGPTLRQLLADAESRGELAIEENGARTSVTLLAPELFAPASASVNPRYVRTLREIGAAIEKVPGRVLVEGHTDDQPLKSLAFHDNYELSRERAASVVRILRGEVRNGARLEVAGRGPSAPRYRPESEPENRARNRRVEIIHVRE
jgi:type VI secretion system protein ImpK